MASKRHWGYSAAQLRAWQPALTITVGRLSDNVAFVAEIDGRTGGFYVLVATAPALALEHFWVHPDCMNRGLGRALLEHARATAAGAGASHIRIDADPNAEAFYLACGARRDGVVAAPIPGHPGRVRPQLILPVAAPATKPGADAG